MAETGPGREEADRFPWGVPEFIWSEGGRVGSTHKVIHTETEEATLWAVVGLYSADESLVVGEVDTKS